MPSCLFCLFSASVSWWSPSRGPILIPTDRVYYSRKRSSLLEGCAVSEEEAERVRGEERARI